MDEDNFGSGFYGESKRFARKWGFYEWIIQLSKAQIFGRMNEVMDLNIIESLNYLSYEKELSDLKNLAQKEAETKSKMKQK